MSSNPSGTYHQAAPSPLRESEEMTIRKEYREPSLVVIAEDTTNEVVDSTSEVVSESSNVASWTDGPIAIDYQERPIKQ